MPEIIHIPVLLSEVLEYLNLRPGMIVVDCTVGGGGHSHAILEKIMPGGKLIGLDRDPAALAKADEALSVWGKENYCLVHSSFARLRTVLEENGMAEVDGVLFDLGVSSFQLDEEERGFSYKHDALLDMRMDQTCGMSAHDLVNKASFQELSDIIYKYGEERWARRIARFIVSEREKEPIDTTGRLVEVIKMAIPKGARKDGPHPAKRTFQALRIAVNGELEILADSLEQGIAALKTGGHLAVITFHSLEDRIAKRVFQQFSRGCTCPQELPACICQKEPEIRIITGKPVTAKEEELLKNPRSRSAKLRVVEKTGPVLKEKRGEYS